MRVDRIAFICGTKETKGDNMNIQEKLLKIRTEVEYIQKTEKGDKGILYVDPAILLKTIRGKMDELKLLLIPEVGNSVVECVDFPSKNNPNAKNFIFHGAMTYTWVDAGNPEDKVSVSWALVGKHMQDPAMAFGSSLTYTERYFLLKFFQIPTAKDDPEYFENKTKPKSKAKEITIGNENLKDMGLFCKKHEIVTAKAKTAFAKKYKIDIYSTTIEEFNNIFEQALIDYGEEL